MSLAFHTLEIVNMKVKVYHKYFYVVSYYVIKVYIIKSNYSYEQVCLYVIIILIPTEMFYNLKFENLLAKPQIQTYTYEYDISYQFKKIL